jgi:pimeloyl-ACP methyl ester carboxylesterase
VAGSIAAQVVSRHRRHWRGVEVLDWGGSGRALLLMHGGGDSAHVFDDMAPVLAKRYRVVGFTRRGHRGSSAPTTGYGFVRYAEDAVRVMDAVGLERPVVVGHSGAGEGMHVLGTRYPTRIAGSCTSTRHSIAETTRTARPTTRFGARCRAPPVPDRATWRPSRRCDRSSRTSRGSLFPRRTCARVGSRIPTEPSRACGRGPPDHSGDVERAAGRVQAVQA